MQCEYNWTIHVRKNTRDAHVLSNRLYFVISERKWVERETKSKAKKKKVIFHIQFPIFLEPRYNNEKSQLNA